MTLGFGTFEIKESNYDKLREILSLDLDIFLDIINMSKYAIPVISINIENISKEGPLPYSNIRTEVGMKRFNELKKNNVI